MRQLVQHRFTRSAGWAGAPAALMSTASFGFYVPIGSAVSALNRNVSFDGWLKDSAEDLTGVDIGTAAGMADSFEAYVNSVCPKKSCAP